MRTLTLALVATAGLMAATVTSGASAAGPGVPPNQPPQAAAVQQAQFYPGYPHWGNQRYYHRRPHHYRSPWWRGHDRRRYSQAEELNRRELGRLGVAP